MKNNTLNSTPKEAFKQDKNLEMFEIDTHSPEMISRREALKRSGLLAGGVFFAPAIAGFLQGCSATTGNYQTIVFTSAQSEAIRAIADAIIPETDTPSASQVGVPAFIDQVLNRNSSLETRNEFMSQFDAFLKDAESEMGMDFIDADAQTQFDYINDLHAIAIGPKDESQDRTLPDFIMKMKQLTVVGYFTSEVGATQVLRYAAMPGPYRGCVPFEEVGRTWAT